MKKWQLTRPEPATSRPIADPLAAEPRLPPASVDPLTLSCTAIIVTLMFVIMTFCYIKKKSIGDFRKSKKALVNFGLFLMIVQGINTFAQIFMPLLALRISHLLEYPIAFIVAVALSELSQIPTNVLILIFFKPVRVRVKKWICCCCHGCKQATKSRSILTNNRAAADV